MTAKTLRSGELMDTLWTRFLVRRAVKYPHSKPPSKREMAALLNVDSLALARWTNDAAHTSKHPGWRIPLKRIPEVCGALLATPDELDDLMICRIQEVLAESEKADVQVLLHWLGPLLDTLAARPEVDNDDRLLLEAHRRARDSVPGAEQLSLPAESVEGIELALRAAWMNAVKEHAEELQAESEATTPEVELQLARAKETAKAALAKKSKKTTIHSFKAETKAAVSALRQAIRSTR